MNMERLVSALAAVVAIGLQAATTYTATEQYVQNVVKAESNRTDLAIGALRQEVQDAKYLTPSAIKAGTNVSVTTNAAGEVTIATDGGVEVDFTTNNTVLVTTIETVAPATNIAKSALAQDVQASLDKADSALQTTGGTMTGELTFDSNANLSFDIPMGSVKIFGSSVHSLGFRVIIDDTVFQEVWLDEIAPLASPAFEGEPTAPTPRADDDSTKIATTAFVQTALSSIPVNPLAGNKYDFSTNADVQRAVRDIAEALGGSVTNFPAIP